MRTFYRKIPQDVNLKHVFICSTFWSYRGGLGRGMYKIYSRCKLILFTLWCNSGSCDKHRRVHKIINPAQCGFSSKLLYLCTSLAALRRSTVGSCVPVKYHMNMETPCLPQRSGNCKRLMEQSRLQLNFSKGLL